MKKKLTISISAVAIIIVIILIWFKKPIDIMDINTNEVMEIDIFEKEDGGIVDTNYERISEYMKEKSIATFSPYYELLDFQISNYVENNTDKGLEATFYYKIIEKNYDKDPDTVGYIKEAKESGNINYKQMYDEYLEPREMNFDLKIVIDKDDIITLYSNVSPNGVEWEETEMGDFILK